MPLDDVSFVYWCSDSDKHFCGYCKNKEGNISNGMWAETLTVTDYQHLIDRGWRRSGKYCYKPIMDQICCPMYTIRCDILNFQLSKSQKKVIKKFNKFLTDGVLNKTEVYNENQHENSDGITDMEFREAPKHLKVNTAEINEAIKSNTELTSSRDNEAPEQSTSVQAEAVLEQKPESMKPKSGLGADPSKPPCKKAKILRRERKQEKLLKQGNNSTIKSIPKNQQKTLQQLLNEIPQDAKHKFRLELINTSIRGADWERVKNIEFALFKKYQTIIHNDGPNKNTMEGFMRFLVKSPLQITLDRLNRDHAHFKRSLEIFQKYQMIIHNETPVDCDETQYCSFLIDTPLLYEEPSDDSEVGFGSFHQLYWLDDKLVAVGVIDILPKCISAVYFFYDPDYRSLTLGTYGSLREVELARQLHEKIPSLCYYYMGYYIHSCQKMRYKGKLVPSYLLCPESYQWVPIEKCLPKLEASKYSRLCEGNQQDDDSCTSHDIDNIRILCGRNVFPFMFYRTKFGHEEEYILAAKLIGKKCIKNLIFIDTNL